MKHWNKTEPFLWYSSFVILFFIILIGNFVTPYLVDDYCLNVYGAGIKEAFIAGINNSIWGWNNMGGCLFSTFHMQFFLNFDKTIFNIANSCLFVLMVYFMSVIINVKQKQRLIVFWTIVMLFLSFVPAPTQTLFWAVGSMQYLWALFFALLFLTPFSVYDETYGKHFSIKVFSFISPLAGLIAGNSQGAVGGVCVIVSLMYIAKWRIERRPIRIWACVGTLSAFMGCVLMVSAPGNYSRLHVAGEVKLASRIVHQLFGILQSQGVIAIILMMCFGFYFKYARRRCLRIDKGIIYGSSALIGLSSLLIVPAAERAFLFFPCFAAIAIGSFCKDIRFDKYVSNILAALFFVLLSNVTISYGAFFYDALRCKNFIDWRANYVEREVAARREVITVPSLIDHEIYRRFTGNLTDLKESPDEWENQGFARFYGAKKISGRSFRGGFDEARRLYDN